MTKKRSSDSCKKKTTEPANKKQGKTAIKKSAKKVQTKAPKKEVGLAKGIAAGFTREGKTDFTPLYQAHRRQMNASGGDIDAMIKLRRLIH